MILVELVGSTATTDITVDSLLSLLGWSNNPHPDQIKVVQKELEKLNEVGIFRFGHLRHFTANELEQKWGIATVLARRLDEPRCNASKLGPFTGSSHRILLSSSFLSRMK